MNKKIELIFLSIIFIYTFANTHAWLFPKTEVSCDYGNPLCAPCYEECKNNPIVSRTTCNVHMQSCCRNGIFQNCSFMKQFPGQVGGMPYNQMGMGQMVGMPYSQMPMMSGQMPMIPGQMGGMPYNQMPMMSPGQFPFPGKIVPQIGVGPLPGMQVPSLDHQIISDLLY